jgi:hypothetical protein
MSTHPQAAGRTQIHPSSLLLEFMRLLDAHEQLAVRLFYLGAIPEEDVCRQTGVDVERFRQIRRDMRDLWRAESAAARGN